MLELVFFTWLSLSKLIFFFFVFLFCEFVYGFFGFCETDADSFCCCLLTYKELLREEKVYSKNTANMYGNVML